MATKKQTPAWIDKLLDSRSRIGEEKYTELFRKINAVRRGTEEEKYNVGRQILKELAADRNIFKSRADAEARKSEIGGRIIRRDKRGRFSKRGKTWQII